MEKSLTKIASLKGCGAFADFKWQDALGDTATLKRRNIVFGWNGSGKTTLSRIFRAIENWQSAKAVADALPDGWDVHLQVQGESAFKLKQDKINKLPPVYVFNRDFVEKSVVGAEGPLSPIITLGKDSADDAARLNKLVVEQAAVEKDSTLATKQQADGSKAWETKCSAGAKKIREDLGGRGVAEFRNFEAPAFKRRFETFANDATKFAAARLTDGDLATQLTTVSAEERQPVSRLPSAVDDLAATLGTVTEVCGRSVVVDAIKSLANTPDVEAWIRAGLALHEKHSATDCLYCGQDLPEGKTEALKRHFDKAYDQLLADIDAALAKLTTAGEACDEVSNAITPADAILAPLRSNYATAAKALTERIALRQQAIAEATQHLKSRQGQPLKEFPVAQVEAPAIAVEIEAVNKLIDRHNKGVADHRKLVKEASDKVADHVAAQYEGEWIAHVAAEKALNEQREKLQLRATELREQITELRRVVEGHAPIAAALNGDLKDYLGHDDLSLLAVDNGYKLQRRGADANVDTLSEGEKTALAVLYFLRCLDDKRVDRAKSLIVIDDPVSSLDSNALYAAITFVCHKLDDAGQVILLTHSFTAFREWKKWCNTKGLAGGGACFQCKSKTVDGKRCATLGKVDELLENYESEYHYLFHYVVRASEGPLAAPELLPLANVARRVLEAFLAFRRPRPSEGEGIGHGKRSMDLDLIQFKPKLPDVSLNQLSRLERFVNTFSHNDNVPVPGSERTPTGESDQVAGILLAFMAGLDPSHVADMKALIGASSPATAPTVPTTLSPPRGPANTGSPLSTTQPRGAS
ncbi:MAG: AAA family ATPase [Planctomycetes bacterium]|nr:AAA family ATPase [Planctomycetota bacterium]